MSIQKRCLFNLLLQSRSFLIKPNYALWVINELLIMKNIEFVPDWPRKSVASNPDWFQLRWRLSAKNRPTTKSSESKKFGTRLSSFSPRIGFEPKRHTRTSGNLVFLLFYYSVLCNFVKSNKSFVFEEVLNTLHLGSIISLFDFGEVLNTLHSWWFLKFFFFLLSDLSIKISLSFGNLFVFGSFFDFSLIFFNIFYFLGVSLTFRRSRWSPPATSSLRLWSAASPSSSCSTRAKLKSSTNIQIRIKNSNWSLRKLTFPLNQYPSEKLKWSNKYEIFYSTKQI